MNILDHVEVLPQSQESLKDQLADLVRVANKLGLYDAADAVTQIHGNVNTVKYGCHCDIENTISGEPDDCVLDSGAVHDCIYAKEGMRKEQCEYWCPVKPKQPEVEEKEEGVDSQTEGWVKVIRNMKNE